MHAVAYELAGNFPVDQPCADHSRFPVMQRPHGVEHMGQVHNVHLHALNHLLIGGVGMPGLQNDAPFNAVKRQLPHVF